ncbi:acyloxyacyl hydrolase [Spirulina sp. 06S082]|uniref:acyloxyacyl hydrolase n=1 Tax=Spirulina sp. 06S082 TaxID=3110248 RepID=UPI002B2071EE|nr:acyloxyacyl hydrolase [Spirulina sp. 06S082]MEA5472134.1 acyloxyacyl hydrolase [Spirulina sp. 06S082]
MQIQAQSSLLFKLATISALFWVSNPSFARGVMVSQPVAENPENLLAQFEEMPAIEEDEFPESQAIEIPKLETKTLAIEAEELLENQDLPFGTVGQNRWYIQGAGATNLDSDDDGEFGLVGAGLSYFFAEGHSVNLELNNLAVIQKGKDALGMNLAVILRWHFYRDPDWSLYLDGGAGILGTTENVPSGGSSFNFTPQAGLGATIRMNGDQRLLLGLRWHHISNANLFTSNPGRDSVMGYIGITWPR